MSVEIHLAIWLVEQTLYQSLHAFLFVFFLDNFPVYSSPDVHIFFRIISNFHFVLVCSFFYALFFIDFFLLFVAFSLVGGKCYVRRYDSCHKYVLSSLPSVPFCHVDDHSLPPLISCVFKELILFTEGGFLY